MAARQLDALSTVSRPAEALAQRVSAAEFGGSAEYIALWFEA